MKKAILLTAIAGTFALAANAQTPAQFKGENPSASNKLYVLLQQDEEKTSFLSGDNLTATYGEDEVIGWNFVNVPSSVNPDVPNLFFLRDEETGKKWGWKYVSSVASPDNWFWPLQSEADEETIYPFALSEQNPETGAYTIIAMGSLVENGDDASVYKYMLNNGGVHRINWNGEPLTDVTADQIPWNYPGLANVMFISQAQMNFHNKAQEIADAFQKDPLYTGGETGETYNGQARQDLIDAVETEGTDWVGQLAALEAAEQAFKDAIDKLGTDLADNEVVYMGGANPYEKVINITGNPGDVVEFDYEVKDGYEMNFTIPAKGDVIVGEDGTATATIKFNNVETYGVEACQAQSGITLDIYIANILKTAGAEIYGAEPTLSYDSTGVARQDTVITMTAPGEIEIPFYAYGYFQPGNIMAQPEVTGETDNIKVAVEPRSFKENNLDPIYAESEDAEAEPEVIGYNNLGKLIVTFAPEAPGADQTVLHISNGVGDELTIAVRAAWSTINVVEEEVRFGANGAEKVITIEYNKFDGPNDAKILTYNTGKMMADPTINIEFVDANGDHSNELHGTGTIQAIVKYAPTAEPSAQETAYTFFAIDSISTEFVPTLDENGDEQYDDNEQIIGTNVSTEWANEAAWDNVIISHAIPALQVYLDTNDEKIYIFNEENEEHLYELHFQNIALPYDLSDIAVRTCTDIFEVKDVYFVGTAEDGYVHFSVIYKPKAKNTEYTDQIVVTCGDAAPCTFDIVGEKVKAVSYGVSGIESVEVEAANAAAFNVAGQRVNNNAKGLVIKNGVKNFVK